MDQLAFTRLESIPSNDVWVKFSSLHILRSHRKPHSIIFYVGVNNNLFAFMSYLNGIRVLFRKLVCINSSFDFLTQAISIEGKLVPLAHDHLLIRFDQRNRKKRAVI